MAVRKRRSNAVSSGAVTIVKDFFCRDDVSRALPGQRYCTKKYGPGRVMNSTLASAYKQYVLENPTLSVGFTMFAYMRPKNIRLVSQVPHEVCLCVYCINITHKVKALHVQMAKQTDMEVPVPNSEVELLNQVLCDRDGRFHKTACVEGTRQKCSNWEQKIRDIYRPILANTTDKFSWQVWEPETYINKKGESSNRRQLKVVTGSAPECVESLIEQFQKPSPKTVSMPQHLFTMFFPNSCLPTTKEKSPLALFTGGARLLQK